MIPSVRPLAPGSRWLARSDHAPDDGAQPGLLHWSVWRPAALTLGLMLLVVVFQKLALFGLAEAAGLVVGQDVIASVAQAGGADYVYSGLVLSMLGNATPAGIALRAPFDGALQSMLPGFYAGSSYLPPWTWIGVVFASGSSAVGAQLVQTVLNLMFVTVGCTSVLTLQAAVHAGRRRTTFIQLIQIASLLAAATGVGAQLLLPWTNGSPGEMALSMVSTKVLGMDSATYDASLSHSLWVSPAINLGGVIVAMLMGVFLAAAACWLRRRRFLPLILSGQPMSRSEWRSAAPVAIAAFLLLSPLQHGATFEDPAGSVNKDLAIASYAARSPIPTGPSVVTITKDQGLFAYQVNGVPQFIRGIGYNAITAGEPEDQRVTRYDRDFAAIRGIGANTITGWDESEFDEVLMRQAAAHGLGVILPLDLQPGLAYDDPATRDQAMAAIESRVESFKDSPALRIWGLGNEVIHDVVNKRLGDSVAFANFLIEAADRVHELDPNHPVIYRDAEDVYVRPIAQRLGADGLDRPWFMYGMNFFTTRLESALAKGPARSLDQPLLVSEFGPVGLRGTGRAVVYSQLWKIITANRGLVVGGCAYVWTTDGPEPLDRAFGLTNADGQPVDASLSTLADLYRAGEAQDAADSGQKVEHLLA